MSASAQCPHNQAGFTIRQAIMTDSNMRYLEISGACSACGAGIRFRGAPFGLSPLQPTMAADGSEIVLPVMFGEEAWDGRGAGAIGSAVVFDA